MSPLRVLVAPDKFKGTLTAPEAGAAIARGLLRVLPDARVTVLPMADGGEGTVDAVVRAGAGPRSSTVTGPLGDPVEARWALVGATAVIEMAQASGLAHVTPAPSPATALAASTEGTGELLLAAVRAGARRIVLGVGGSASSDGGVGALRALGVRFRNRDGREVTGGGGRLHEIAAIDLTGLDPALADTELVLCSDVDNTLLGVRGAARLFSPQKGADAAAVATLEAGLTHLAALLEHATGRRVTDLAGGGAAGGIVAGLHAALGARRANGVDQVAELVGLDAALAGSDLVIVGEGSLDEQSLLGKTPVGTARRAARFRVPAVAVVGRNQVGGDALPDENLVAIAAAADLAPDPDAAQAEAARWVEEAAVAAVRRVVAEGQGA